jgi:CheY-like chemotaxis protein
LPTDILNIVIADDDLDDVELFQEAIAHVCPDVNVTIATDGLQLIQLLDEIPIPDAIVLDLNMPRKSGIQCLEEIRANADFADVPIIMLSTSTSPKDAAYCLKTGASHYLVKPNSFAAMKQIVEGICSGTLINGGITSSKD